MDLSDLGGLGDLAKQMQDAYTDGTNAMNKAGKEAAKDMKPDHEIELDIKLSAKVEGHDYRVDARVTFEIELNPILGSGAGDLSKALEGLDVDLGDDKGAVMDQLGQPRAIGVVKDIEVKELVLSNDAGKVDAELNKDGTLLATLKDGELLINCESVFSFPDNPDVYVAIPSMDKMQKNMVIGLKEKGKKKVFNWTEKDKDNLEVEGSIILREL
ncbi:MAG: hypothetical protein PHS44_02845 [Candidatus Dojkabacteria bacterium]|jgi:hypothetical protein|nr:hypothetical protein [Candidatus Dojkabacteria bacterium]